MTAQGALTWRVREVETGSDNPLSRNLSRPADVIPLLVLRDDTEPHDRREDLARVLGALAPATRRAYEGHARRFGAWAGDLGIRNPSDRVIADYAGHLRKAGSAPATVKQAVAALRAIARGLGLEPSGALATAEIRRAGRENRDRRRGSAPSVEWEAADLAARLAERAGDLGGIRDAAIIRVTSDALLRVAEVSSLDVSDFDIREDGSGRLLLRASKTDQEGEGAVLFLGPPTVSAIQVYLAAAGHEDGPLFQRARRGGHPAPGRLSDRSIRSVLTRRLAEAGADGASGHSLRRGSAASLAARGASLVELQQAGRWQDPRQPARYAAGELAARGPVARLRYRKDSDS